MSDFHGNIDSYWFNQKINCAELSSFPSVCIHLSCSSQWAYGHDFWYITYILASKSTPLAVTNPHGQLASG